MRSDSSTPPGSRSTVAPSCSGQARDQRRLSGAVEALDRDQHAEECDVSGSGFGALVRDSPTHDRTKDDHDHTQEAARDAVPDRRARRQRRGGVRGRRSAGSGEGRDRDGRQADRPLARLAGARSLVTQPVPDAGPDGLRLQGHGQGGRPPRRHARRQARSSSTPPSWPTPSSTPSGRASASSTRAWPSSSIAVPTSSRRSCGSQRRPRRRRAPPPARSSIWTRPISASTPLARRPCSRPTAASSSSSRASA